MIGEKRVRAIILVAGNSTRFGTGKNKNFDLLNGKKFLSEIQDIENIFLFTDHLLKNIQYIFECIESEFIGEYESK